MSRKVNEWTEDEEQIILEEINSGDHETKKDAYEAASERLDGRSAKACNLRYHKMMNSDDEDEEDDDVSEKRPSKQSFVKSGTTDREVLKGLLNFLFDYLSKDEKAKFLSEKVEKLVGDNYG